MSLIFNELVWVEDNHLTSTLFCFRFLFRNFIMTKGNCRILPHARASVHALTSMISTLTLKDLKPVHNFTTSNNIIIKEIDYQINNQYNYHPIFTPSQPTFYSKLQPFTNWNYLIVMGTSSWKGLLWLSLTGFFETDTAY